MWPMVAFVVTPIVESFWNRNSYCDPFSSCGQIDFPVCHRREVSFFKRGLRAFARIWRHGAVVRNWAWVLRLWWGLFIQGFSEGLTSFLSHSKCIDTNVKQSPQNWITTSNWCLLALTQFWGLCFDFAVVRLTSRALERSAVGRGVTAVTPLLFPTIAGTARFIFFVEMRVMSCGV